MVVIIVWFIWFILLVVSTLARWDFVCLFCGFAAIPLWAWSWLAWADAMRERQHSTQERSKNA